MNLRAARLVLRPRGAADVLDLAVPFCVGNWRVLLPLAGLALAPCFAACWAARLALHWPWQWVWVAAVVLAGLAHAPFTVACGELLFHPPRTVRLRSVLGRTLARTPPFVVAYLSSRLAHAVAFTTLVLAPVSVGTLFVVEEAVLLEGAGPFAALGRSGRAVRGQGVAAFGIAVALALLPVAGLLAGEVTGSALVTGVLQLGEPFGNLWARGGTPYALAGFFATVPLSAAARFLKYIDLRTRKEGWDIQLRFTAIAAGQANSGEKSGDTSADNPAGTSATRGSTESAA